MPKAALQTSRQKAILPIYRGLLVRLFISNHFQSDCDHLSCRTFPPAQLETVDLLRATATSSGIVKLRALKCGDLLRSFSLNKTIAFLNNEMAKQMLSYILFVAFSFSSSKSIFSMSSFSSQRAPAALRCRSRSPLPPPGSTPRQVRARPCRPSPHRPRHIRPPPTHRWICGLVRPKTGLSAIAFSTCSASGCSARPWPAASSNPLTRRTEVGRDLMLFLTNARVDVCIWVRC